MPKELCDELRDEIKKGKNSNVAPILKSLYVISKYGKMRYS